MKPNIQNNKRDPPPPGLLEDVGETGGPPLLLHLPHRHGLWGREHDGKPQGRTPGSAWIRLEIDPEATEMLPSVLIFQQQNNSFAQTRSLDPGS